MVFEIEKVDLGESLRGEIDIFRLNLGPTSKSELLDLFLAFGEPAIDGVEIQADGTRAEVYVQDVMLSSKRLRTQGGHLRLSASNGRFAPHTDCASSPCPPEYLVLFCRQHSLEGGQTTLVRLSDVIDKLDKDVIKGLLHRKFGFGFGQSTILIKIDGEFQIRYNLVEIAKYNTHEFDAVEEYLLSSLESAIRESTFTTRLQAGECLVLKNREILHGREAFENGSKRHFFRMRFNIDERTRHF